MMLYNSYIEFRYVNDHKGQQSEITHRMPLDQSLSDILENFERFLHGVGYLFTGTLDIVDSEDSDDISEYKKIMD